MWNGCIKYKINVLKIRKWKKMWYDLELVLDFVNILVKGRWLNYLLGREIIFEWLEWY